jgi:hypothetical protein
VAGLALAIREGERSGDGFGVRDKTDPRKRAVNRPSRSQRSVPNALMEC